MRVSTILDQIDLGTIALPEFQRGYVWNRDQVRGLMHSLYHRHPVGGLLVWVTQTESTATRGNGPSALGTVQLLLDGQQRITSLYGIVRGRPPRFFEGNAQAFTGLYFNLDDETFEFYAPLKMRDNPLWISVTDLMQQGVGPFIGPLYANAELAPKADAYVNRITALHGVQTVDLHVEQITGEDKTVDIVVDIFNRVNSGGTKLSKGDLALAKICAEWPDARQELKDRLEKWRTAGFGFRLDWLLRCITAVVTGQAMFSGLKDVDTPEFREGLKKTEKAVDALLNLIAARLGLDHDAVLGSPYSLAVLARHFTRRGETLGDHVEQSRLLYWYVHTLLWGRYAGATESALNQDLRLLDDTPAALDALIGQLRLLRGDLRLRGDDFLGWSRGARFYPLLYLMTRVDHARDWCSGLELSSHLLGSLSRLQVHHVFPKALLYRNDYPRSEVNAIANLTFLTQVCNLNVSDSPPAEYLEEVVAKFPGAVESHWIPLDRDLWRVERYRDFLAARRELLANAANAFLDGLLSGVGQPVATDAPISILDRVAQPTPGGVADEDEERVLMECNAWVVAQGLPGGEMTYELLGEAGTPVAILDLAWPDGLQQGLSQPVALLLDEDQETVERVNETGYRYFTDVGSFRRYVEREILALDAQVA